MKPERRLFGLQYFGQTVRCYQNAVAGAGDPDDLEPHLTWAHDALSAYFGRVASHPIVDELRPRFDLIGARLDDLIEGPIDRPSSKSCASGAGFTPPQPAPCGPTSNAS